MPSDQDDLQNYWKLNKFIYVRSSRLKALDRIKILKHAFCYKYYKMRRWCGKWNTTWLYRVSGSFLCEEEKENLDLIKAQFHLAVQLKISSQYKGWRKKKKKKYQKRGEKKIFLSFTRQCSFFNPQNNPISSLCLYKKKNYKREKKLFDIIARHSKNN